MKTLIILTFAITIVFLNSGVSFSNKVTSETENYSSNLTDLTFEEFADDFILNAFQSIDNFTLYSEKSFKIISSSFVVLPSKNLFMIRLISFIIILLF